MERLISTSSGYCEVKYFRTGLVWEKCTIRVNSCYYHYCLKESWGPTSSSHTSLVICVLLIKFLTKENTLCCLDCEARVDQLPLSRNLPPGFHLCYSSSVCFGNSLSSPGPGLIFGCRSEGGAAGALLPEGGSGPQPAAPRHLVGTHLGSHSLWMVLPVNLNLPLSHQDLTPGGAHRGLVLQSRAEVFGQHLLYPPSSAKPNSEFPHTSLSLFCFPKPKSTS